MNDIQTETPLASKTPARKKFLKIGVIAFAVIGVAVTLLIAAAFIWRNQPAEYSEDVRMLFLGYPDAIPTRFGVVIKHAENHGSGVVVDYRLVRILAQRSYAEDSERILVVGYVQLKPEIATKVLNNEIDLTQTADALPMEMLIDLKNQPWVGGAVYLKKKKGAWDVVTWIEGIFNAEPSEAGPKVSFIDLSPKHRSFAVTDPLLAPHGYTTYFSLFGKEFNDVLGYANKLDDLDSCLQYEAEQAQQAAAKAGESANEEGSAEETPEEVPDYACVRAVPTIKPVKHVTNQYYDLEVVVEGEGRNKLHRQERYVLTYSPKDKRYGYKRDAGNGSWWADFLSDFTATVNAERLPSQ